MLSLAVVLPGYHHDYTVYTETLYDKLEGAYLYDVFFLPEPLLKNTPFNDWSLVCQARLSTIDEPENVIVWLKEKKVL